MVVCRSCRRELPDEFLICPFCGEPLGIAGAERRKTVTVVFCDITGSTALGESSDPEALRALLGRYFVRMKRIVERHGGVVEKFIGDAVLAVFGVPVAHEDDALRACRAAVEMRAALPELRVAARIGVNTGEVVTGTAERLVTGDAVNVAARLEQAAAPGTILIGEETHGLVRGAIVAEAGEPLTLRGKSEPVRAFRLVSLLGSPERGHRTSFVGRLDELEALEQAWGRALMQARCEFVTVVGEAGIGKSRLVAQAVDSLGARVVRGRCLPYGEGITYRPVTEIVKQLAALPSEPGAAGAVRSLLGESEQGTSADQIAWAFRKLLEEQAPLVAVFDDIQWGEETFVDLLEGTYLLSAGAPLLLICMARPELLERRPGWPGVLRLEPLGKHEADELIRDEVPRELADRIAHAAGGNPLFISEMLTMAREGADVEVPPTLKALLTARLDQLEEAERRVLERGSVEGELFHRGSVQALSPEEPQVTSRLTALVRRELVRPERAEFEGDDGFRFRHLLIRDAAYEGLPKRVRAELHVLFAEWLTGHPGLVELDELVGYHLEQAVRYRRELGEPADDLALRAGERLAAAGRRALWREDRRAAAALLERALEMTRPLRLDVLLEVDLAETSFINDSRGAAEIVEEAAARAAAAADPTNEVFARAIAAYHRHNRNECSTDQLEALALDALRLLEQAGDDAALVHVWNALGIGVANGRAHWADLAHAAERAIDHARRAGQQRSGLFFLQTALVLGPVPASEALTRLDQHLTEAAVPFSLFNRASLLAMLDRFDEAFPLAREASDRQRDQDGRRIGESRLAEIAALAGDHQAAAEHLRELCDWLEERDQPALLSTYISLLARELCELGRYDEAKGLAERGRELSGKDDISSQTLWRQVLARVHAHRGQHAEAQRLGREAMELIQRTDGLNFQGDALLDFAEVLRASNHTEEAAATLSEALDCYQRKENIPMIRHVRDRLNARGGGDSGSTSTR